MRTPPRLDRLLDAYGDFGDDGQCGFCLPGRHCLSPGPGGSASADGATAPKTPTIESTAMARLILVTSDLPSIQPQCKQLTSEAVQAQPRAAACRA